MLSLLVSSRLAFNSQLHGSDVHVYDRGLGFDVSNRNVLGANIDKCVHSSCSLGEVRLYARWKQRHLRFRQLRAFMDRRFRIRFVFCNCNVWPRANMITHACQIQVDGFLMGTLCPFLEIFCGCLVYLIVSNEWNPQYSSVPFIAMCMHADVMNSWQLTRYVSS